MGEVIYGDFFFLKQVTVEVFSYAERSQLLHLHENKLSFREQTYIHTQTVTKLHTFPLPKNNIK